MARRGGEIYSLWQHTWPFTLPCSIPSTPLLHVPPGEEKKMPRGGRAGHGRFQSVAFQECVPRRRDNRMPRGSGGGAWTVLPCCLSRFRSTMRGCHRCPQVRVRTVPCFAHSTTIDGDTERGIRRPRGNSRHLRYTFCEDDAASWSAPDSAGFARFSFVRVPTSVRGKFLGSFLPTAPIELTRRFVQYLGFPMGSQPHAFTYMNGKVAVFDIGGDSKIFNETMCEHTPPQAQPAQHSLLSGM